MDSGCDRGYPSFSAFSGSRLPCSEPQGAAIQPEIAVFATRMVASAIGGRKMEKQRLITAARRRAKALSRGDGRSYQAHLDEIAKSVGHVDWTGFVADPRPIEQEGHERDPTAGIIDAPEAGDPRNGFAGRPDRASRHWPAMVAGLNGNMLLMQLAAIAILAFYVFCMTSRTAIKLIIGNETVFLPAFEFMVIASLYLTIPAAVLSATTLGIVTYRTIRHGARPTKEVWARKTFEFVVSAGLAACIWQTVMYIVPNMITSIPVGDVTTMIEDQKNQRVVSFLGGRVPIAYARPSTDRGTSQVAVVMLDSRDTPRNLRGIEPIRHGGQTMIDSYKDNPIIRMSFTIDCRTGMQEGVTLETARSYRAPAAHATSLPSSKGRRRPLLTGEDLKFVCTPHSA